MEITYRILLVSLHPIMRAFWSYLILLIVVLLAVIAIVLLVATMIFSVVLLRNFGKGLKQACAFIISHVCAERLLMFEFYQWRKSKIIDKVRLYMVVQQAPR